MMGFALFATSSRENKTVDTSDLQNNITRYLTSDVDREFWERATPDERERFVVILKADGLGEAVKQVKKCAALEAQSKD